MRVLITGTTGFLGSFAARTLLDRGHELAMLVRPTSDTRRIADVRDAISALQAADPSAAVAAFSPAVVVHAATCYGRRGESAQDLIEANVRLPLALLDASRKARVQRFINCDTTLPPDLNAYTASKAEFVARARALPSSATTFVNVRLQSLYGPTDDDSKAHMQVLRACLSNHPHIELTPGEQYRDFIFSEDAARGITCLAEADLPAAPWHDFDLGTGEATRLREFFEMIRRETRSSTQLRFGALPYRPGERMFSVADPRPLQALGWHASTSLVEGVRAMVNWARSG